MTVGRWFINRLTRSTYMTVGGLITTVQCFLLCTLYSVV